MAVCGRASAGALSAAGAAARCALSTSLWQTPYAAKHEVDVVVVGGGICGLAAAAEVGERGQSVVVMESSAIGSGASGRNAGYLIRGFSGNFAAAVRDFGKGAAVDLWNFTEENRAMLQSAVGTDFISATPSCLVAASSQQAQELEEASALMHECGLEHHLLRPGDSTADDAVWRGPVPPQLALVNPGDATVDPMRLVQALAGQVQGRLMQNTHVSDMHPLSDGRWEVVTEGGERVVAGSVLIATNGYTPLQTPLVPAALSKVIQPVKGQMMAVQSLARLDFAYYADDGDKYFRPGPEGTLLMGGCRRDHAAEEVGTDDAISSAVQADLAAYLDGMTGHSHPPPIAQWAGTMGFTPDGLPAAGSLWTSPASGAGPVWWVGGFTGHGMSMAYLFGRQAAAAMLGHGDMQLSLPLSRFGFEAPEKQTVA